MALRLTALGVLMALRPTAHLNARERLELQTRRLLDTAVNDSVQFVTTVRSSHTRTKLTHVALAIETMLFERTCESMRQIGGD